MSAVDDFVDEFNACLGFGATAFAEELEAEDGSTLHTIGTTAWSRVSEGTVSFGARLLVSDVANERYAFFHALLEVFYIGACNESRLHGLVLPTAD